MCKNSSKSLGVLFVCATIVDSNTAAEWNCHLLSYAHSYFQWGQTGIYYAHVYSVPTLVTSLKDNPEANR